MSHRPWLPKFTIRQMLALTAGFALFSMILGMAARGSLVAYGIGFGFLSLAVPALVGASLYWLAKGYARILDRGRPGATDEA